MKREMHCKHDKQVTECIKCWPVFCYETGYTVERRALEWLLGNDTGSSSKTLCAHMLGIKIAWRRVPWDADDRSRCIRLLRWIPEWLPRLDELAEVEPGRPASVNGEENHTYGWKQQIPLIREEGKF